MNELRMPLWVCAVDFKKAFDTVEHTAIWAALKEQQVPARYVDLLRSLYAGQAHRSGHHRQRKQEVYHLQRDEAG